MRILRRSARGDRGARAAGRPLLAVDVDGVVVLLGHDERSFDAATRMQVIDGMMHCVSLAAGDGLRRLAETYELVWATGWEARANEHFPELLGIPKLPYVSFDGAARFGSAHWKLGPLEAFSRGRPMAWVDDSFDDRCRTWAEARPAPTMLVPIEPSRGLREAHVEALVEWAGTLA